VRVLHVDIYTGTMYKWHHSTVIPIMVFIKRKCNFYMAPKKNIRTQVSTTAYSQVLIHITEWTEPTLRVSELAQGSAWECRTQTWVLVNDGPQLYHCVTQQTMLSIKTNNPPVKIYSTDCLRKVSAKWHTLTLVNQHGHNYSLNPWLLWANAI